MGLKLVDAQAADQRFGCDIACASPPLAPPFQGWGRWAGGFRMRAAGDNRRLGVPAFVVYRAGQPARLARWWTPRRAATSRSRARLAAKNRPRRGILLSFSSRAHEPSAGRPDSFEDSCELG
jgi:hypothetical protein